MIAEVGGEESSSFIKNLYKKQIRMAKSEE